jgi:hypothetical protein
VASDACIAMSAAVRSFRLAGSFQKWADLDAAQFAFSTD